VNESLHETFRLIATTGGIKGGHDCVRGALRGDYAQATTWLDANVLALIKG
jgi:hypothetical protein